VFNLKKSSSTPTVDKRMTVRSVRKLTITGDAVVFKLFWSPGVEKENEMKLN
jgi:hypothetical protein